MEELSLCQEAVQEHRYYVFCLYVTYYQHSGFNQINTLQPWNVCEGEYGPSS